MRQKLLIAFPMLEEVVQKAQEDFEVITSTKDLSLSEIIEASAEHHIFALMISGKQNIGSDAFDGLSKNLKVIATASVGYDHIDLKKAKECEILVTNTPDVLSEATADQAFLLMLSTAKRLPESMRTMHSGWGKNPGFSEKLGRDLRGKNLAIFGMGRIGQALADKGRAFGMNILYCNRKRLTPDLEKGAQYFESFESMLPKADILSLNAPATAKTYKIMNEKTFALLPEGAIFVNVARGSLVDEEALIQVLETGHLFGAGLDVFRDEPNIDPRLLKFPNVTLSPHVGSATLETRIAMGLRALENIQAVRLGQSPRDELTTGSHL